MIKNWLYILIMLPFSLSAQFSFTPFVGLNSTKLTESYSGYAKGGNYGILGVEVERQINLSLYSPLHFSIVTGVSYLSNGFDRTSSFTFTSSYYSYELTNIRTRYIQVPAMVRINWRPFALVENWYLFFGAGVSFNQLTYAHMEEQADKINFTGSSFSPYPGIYPPPQLLYYSDSQDVTSRGVRNSIFKRFELGMKFKHVQVTWRISLSTQDMYFKGIEKNWNVPASSSFYINAHNSRGITKEKYSELIFGWRF